MIRMVGTRWWGLAVEGTRVYTGIVVISTRGSGVRDEFFHEGFDLALNSLYVCVFLCFPGLPLHVRVHDWETRDAV